MSKLDAIRGHRTFLLVTLLTIPLMVRSLLLSDAEFNASLVQWAAIIASVGGGLWMSKRGEADKTRAKNGHDGATANTERR